MPKMTKEFAEKVCQAYFGTKRREGFGSLHSFLELKLGSARKAKEALVLAQGDLTWGEFVRRWEAPVDPDGALEVLCNAITYSEPATDAEVAARTHAEDLLRHLEGGGAGPTEFPSNFRQALERAPLGPVRNLLAKLDPAPFHREGVRLSILNDIANQLTLERIGKARHTDILVILFAADGAIVGEIRGLSTALAYLARGEHNPTGVNWSEAVKANLDIY